MKREEKFSVEENMGEAGTWHDARKQHFDHTNYYTLHTLPTI